SNFLTGVIQSNQRFLVPALAPVVYNLGIIFGIVVLSPKWGIYGPVFGVVLGAFLHLLIQVPLSLKLGFRYSFSWNFKLQEVKEVGRLMLPRTLGLAVNQIELTVAVYLATSMTSGSLAIFYFAQHLMNLPVGLFGSTISQAALPSLSRQTAKKKIEEFKNTFLTSFNQIMFLALPAGMILLILRIPLVRIVFGAPNFPWKATLLTGKVLAIFSLSIFAQAAIQLLVRGFYALHDTKSPFWIGALSVLVNVALSLLFILGFDLGILGLAWAITLASFLQAILLILFLNKKVDGFDRKRLFIPFLKTSVATLLTGMALWAPMRLMDKFIVDTTRVLGLVLLTVVVFIIGMGFYLILAYLLRIEALSHFATLFKRFSRWQSVLQESEEIITTSSSDLVSEET
ncbi:MAG: murein biosynthesis integral membrane protein MurJ, partial [Patescibacteria group bacterium]